MPSATAALQFLKAFMAADVANISGAKSPLNRLNGAAGPF